MVRLDRPGKVVGGAVRRELRGRDGALDSARRQEREQGIGQGQGQSPEQRRGQAHGRETDGATEVWGYWEGTGEPAAARRFANWTSVFPAAPCLPPTLLRVIHRGAGCHIYEDAGDTLHANRQFVAVRSDQPGRHTIVLPEACNVRDALTGRPVCHGSRKFTFDAGVETCLFALQPAEAAADKAGR